MTRGTITNKQTGLEITGACEREWGSQIDFRIEGTRAFNIFSTDEWDFTPDPEPIKEGVYAPRREDPEQLAHLSIRKYRGGKWRDADGYALANQNVDVSRLVRLVPEA